MTGSPGILLTSHPKLQFNFTNPLISEIDSRASLLLSIAGRDCLTRIVRQNDIRGEFLESFPVDKQKGKETDAVGRIPFPQLCRRAALLTHWLPPCQGLALAQTWLFYYYSALFLAGDLFFLPFLFPGSSGSLPFWTKNRFVSAPFLCMAGARGS